MRNAMDKIEVSRALCGAARASVMAIGLCVPGGTAATAQTSVQAASPVPEEGPVILIGEEDLLWDPQIERFLVSLTLPRQEKPAPLADPPGRMPQHARAARAHLNRLIAQGKAAGFQGLIYDNRDAEHSPLERADHPGVTRLVYDRALLQQGITRGNADDILFDRPVVGNSSTAFKNSAIARGLMRSAMTRPGGPAQAWINYGANHFYVYPEHRDHDAVDLFPANWAYNLSSQGSSYDDQPFVQAALWALAAMQPQTRDFLERERLVVPTLQMLLRRTQAHVQTAEAYRSGVAHPTAFDQKAIRLDRIVASAQALTPETVPPLPVLNVESETFGTEAGLVRLSEYLFDTPSAVARVWRGFEWEKEMVLSAGAIGPASGAPDQFEWVLLRGDPELVQIEPLDAAGQRVRLRVAWHDRRPISPREERETDRVDIGLFVRGAVFDSVPAFVSISFPTHQTRSYDKMPGSVPRLAILDYGTRAAQGQRYDPLLHWSAAWTDSFTYDASGLTGWDRVFHDGRPAVHFDTTGNPRDGQSGVYSITRPDQAGGSVLKFELE